MCACALEAGYSRFLAWTEAEPLWPRSSPNRSFGRIGCLWCPPLLYRRTLIAWQGSSSETKCRFMLEGLILIYLLRLWCLYSLLCKSPWPPCWVTWGRRRCDQWLPRTAPPRPRRRRAAVRPTSRTREPRRPTSPQTCCTADNEWSARRDESWVEWA